MNKEQAKEIIDKISKEEFPYALALAKAYEKLENENQELKERIDKAIEYIKRYNMLISGCWDATLIPDELLQILKGDNNEN